MTELPELKKKKEKKEKRKKKTRKKIQRLSLALLYEHTVVTMCSFRQGLYISYCGKSGIGQRLIIRRSVWVKLSFLGKYVVKFHASK